MDFHNRTLDTMEKQINLLHVQVEGLKNEFADMAKHEAKLLLSTSLAHPLAIQNQSPGNPVRKIYAFNPTNYFFEPKCIKCLKLNFFLRLGLVLSSYTLVVGVAEEQHIVGYDAGAGLLVSLQVGYFAVGDLALHHGSLSLLQVFKYGVAQVWLENHHAMPVCALSPVPVLVSGG